MIAIFSEPNDFHAVAVRWALRRAGEDAEIITTLYDSITSVSTDIKKGVVACTFHPNAIWWRRPRISDIHTAIRPEFESFVKHEWRQFTQDTLGAIKPDTFYVNEPSRAELAELKQYQLIIAQQVGFRVPRTLISNDYLRIIQFIKNNASIGKETIAKCYTPHVWLKRDGSIRSVTTSKIRACDVNKRSAKITPVIFQEFIKPAYEIRVTAIGDHLFALKIAVDAKKDNLMPGIWKESLQEAFVTTSVHTVPKEVRSKLFEIMSIMQIAYAAVDFIVDKSGKYYFLELNQAGQFLFCEEVCSSMKLLAHFCALLRSRSLTSYESKLDESITLAGFRRSSDFRNLRYRALRRGDKVKGNHPFLTIL